jgi:hypothetical protein
MVVICQCPRAWYSLGGALESDLPPKCTCHTSTYTPTGTYSELVSGRREKDCRTRILHGQCSKVQYSHV